MFKEKLAALWAKVVENKETVIRIAGIVGGAVVGVIGATIVANVQEQSYIDALLAEEDEEDLDDDDSRE